MTREITFDILSLQNRKSGPDGSSSSIRRDPFMKNGLPAPYRSFGAESIGILGVGWGGGDCRWERRPMDVIVTSPKTLLESCGRYFPPPPMAPPSIIIENKKGFFLLLGCIFIAEVHLS